MSLQKKEQEAAINLLSNGVAWKQVEHLADKVINEKATFMDIIGVLDLTFKYGQRVEAPRAFEKFFYGINRRPEQTLMSYCADHREALREVMKHGVTLDDELQGWLLLRRASLTSEQKHMIMTQLNGSFSEAKVEAALYYLFGQDYRGGKGSNRGKASHQTQRWPQRRAAHQAYQAEEDDYYEPDTYEDGGPGSGGDDEHYYTGYEDDYDDDYATELDNQTYYQNEGDLPPSGEDWEVEEAYATYLDARRRFNELKTNRGFYPVVALGPDSTATSSPTASSQRPFARKGKGHKGKGGKNKSPPQKGGAQARGKSAMSTSSTPICLRCGSPDHLVADCPQRRPPGGGITSQSPKKARTGHSAHMVSETVPQDDHGLRGLYAQQDGGASSLVCGHEVMLRYIQHYLDHGASPSDFFFRRVCRTFHFGGDNQSQAEWSALLPVHIDGRAGRVECFVVPGSTPMLVGRPVLAALCLRIDYATNSMSLNGNTWTKVPLGRKGEHLIRLDDGKLDTYDPTSLEFDYITEDTLADMTSEPPHQDLRTYLEQTASSIPASIEQALQAHEHSTSEQHKPDEQASDALLEDPSVVRRPVTHKLLRSLAFHQHAMARRRDQTIEAVLLAHESGQLQFWHTVSTQEKHTSQSTCSSMADILNGWDLAIPAVQQQLLWLYYDHLPDVTWLAPPCTAWSQMQNISTTTEQAKEDLAARRWEEEPTHLRLAVCLHNKQHKQGRISIIEAPATAASWHTSAFQPTTPTWTNVPMEPDCLTRAARPLLSRKDSTPSHVRGGFGRCGSSLACGCLAAIPSPPDYVGPRYGTGLRLAPSFVWTMAHSVAAVMDAF